MNQRTRDNETSSSVTSSGVVRAVGEYVRVKVMAQYSYMYFMKSMVMLQELPRSS